jgi:hypothetical protein
MNNNEQLSTNINEQLNTNNSSNDTSNNPTHYKKLNTNNLTVPPTLTSSTSSSTISQISPANSNSRAKQQRKSESDITQNLINSQKQPHTPNLNVSPVHYPPSIPNNMYNSSPNKNPHITVKTNKSLFCLN